MNTTSPLSSFQPQAEQLVRWLTWTLRHASANPALQTDAGGWVEIEAVVNALPVSMAGWTAPTAAEFSQWILSRPDGRFEVCRGRVRAAYGHSLRGIEVARLATPPATLYHGTSRCLLNEILSVGLLPMGRNRVHLTTDLAYARNVARKFADPVVLLVNALAAKQRGIPFFATGNHVWQVAQVAPDFLSTLDDLSTESSSVPGIGDH